MKKDCILRHNLSQIYCCLTQKNKRYFRQGLLDETESNKYPWPIF